MSREARLPLQDAPAEGTVRIVEVGGHRVGLYRVQGTLHALADRCPHRGAPICAGKIGTPIEIDAGALRLGAEQSVVRCPWHKWEYDLQAVEARFLDRDDAYSWKCFNA